MSSGHMSENVYMMSSQEFDSYKRRLFEGVISQSYKENMSGESEDLKDRTKRLSVRLEDYYE